MSQSDLAVEVRNVRVQYGATVVLDGFDLDVRSGEILGFVGPSGAGKSVLLRTILGLKEKREGTIKILGHDIDAVGGSGRVGLDMLMGVLFQHGALFSALNVIENIKVPMREFLNLSDRLMTELAYVKLLLVGLERKDAHKMPSDLSGGMIKRAALARALALDPRIVFLDEPTSGLDPISAAGFDQLIAKLRDTLGLTVYMVTHDLDSLFSVTDRVAVLDKKTKKVSVVGPVETMLERDDPWIQEYFQGPRARQIVNGPHGRKAKMEG